jgi:hypothetical protein
VIGAGTEPCSFCICLSDIIVKSLGLIRYLNLAFFAVVSLDRFETVLRGLVLNLASFAVYNLKTVVMGLY